MNPYRALLLRWSSHRSFIPFVKYVATPMDRLTRRTGHPLTTVGTGLPTVHLTTTGRKSGESRTVPVFGLDIPAGVGLISSNIGQNFRPAWCLNLLAEPHCRLQRGRALTEHVARAATAAERDELWRTGMAMYPAFATYRARVDREIDMFILQPA